MDQNSAAIGSRQVVYCGRSACLEHIIIIIIIIKNICKAPRAN